VEQEERIDPINGPIKDPINDPINGPINDPIKDPINDPINGPIKDLEGRNVLLEERNVHQEFKEC
tara:strand:+ start:170 stop:364 length:195 start_codon:yes stop_codon:yes gene_type:complete